MATISTPAGDPGSSPTPVQGNAETLVPTTSPDHITVAIAHPGATPLQAQLEQLKVPQLRSRAQKEGLADDAIEVRFVLLYIVFPLAPLV